MAADVRWLGHSAFHLSGGGADVLIDPFLTGNPKAAATADEVPADVILVSHAHGDHVGDTVAIAQRFECPVVAIIELRGWLAGQGLPDDVTQNPNKGGTVEFAGVRITLTDANHSSGGDANEYLGEAAGLVFRIPDAPTLYFAGDTNVFASMSLIQRLYAPEVAVLPIGDHFTMGPEEAGVALELLGSKRCVPSHYGTFPLLSGTPERLREHAPDGVEILTPQPGETISL
jgi:L-ascorbate metabolism protein UlaG (beta-lactamase superfamily)